MTRTVGGPFALEGGSRGGCPEDVGRIAARVRQGRNGTGGLLEAKKERMMKRGSRGMTRRDLLKVSTVAGVGLGLPASLWRPARAASKIVIKIGTGVAWDHPENVGARKIKELVEKKAGDRVEVQIFPDNQLGDQRTMVENMRLGTLEITWVTVGFFGSYEPILNIFESGYLFRDSWHAYHVFDGPIGNEVRPLVEKHGVKLLGFYEAGVRHVTNTVRPINTPADLKGLKIRVPQAKYSLSTLKYMGANPVAMSFGELYTALQQKVVDGQENPVSNIYKAKFYEVQKYLSLTGHQLLMHMVMYSDKLWSNLPPDLQKVVRDSVVESQETQRKAVRDDDATLLGALKEKGMQVNAADREAFKKALLPQREEAIKEYGPQVKVWFEQIEATK
jgi:tripartite ATP-independent transporter DctP family solute receptor